MHKINAGDLEILHISKNNSNLSSNQIERVHRSGRKTNSQCSNIYYSTTTQYIKKMLYVCIDLKFLQRSYFWKDQHSAAFYFIYVNVLVLAHLPATLNILDFLQNAYLLRSTQSTVQMYNPFRKEFLMCLLNKL